MIIEILGTLEFVGFLVALFALCICVSRMPWYCKLNGMLFHDGGNDE